MLCQLSYTPIPADELVFRPRPSATGRNGSHLQLGDRIRRWARLPILCGPGDAYSMMEATTPAPTVRPPSRIAKRRPSSIAIGAISSPSIVDVVARHHHLRPFRKLHTSPVTSVVRK